MSNGKEDRAAKQVGAQPRKQGVCIMKTREGGTASTKQQPTVSGAVGKDGKR